jgi:hypothetical protein
LLCLCDTEIRILSRYFAFGCFSLVSSFYAVVKVPAHPPWWGAWLWRQFLPQPLTT